MTALPLPPQPDEALTLAEATRRRLVEHDRHSSPEGLLVLEIARQIEAGGHSGASLASLSNAFGRAMEQALKGAQRETDILDDIFAGTA